MMRSIILLIFFSQADAREINPTSDASDLRDPLVHSLLDRLSDRAISVLSLNLRDVDKTTLAKPGNLAEQGRSTHHRHMVVQNPVRTNRWMLPADLAQAPKSVAAGTSLPRPHVDRHPPLRALERKSGVDWQLPLRAMVEGLPPDSADGMRLTKPLTVVPDLGAEQQVESLAVTRTPRLVIGVAGPSASGKSTFCEELRLRLALGGIRATVLGADRYYRTLNQEDHETAQRGEFNFDELSALDLDLLATHVQQMRAGRWPVRIPKYNFVEHKREVDEDFVEESEAEVLIVEGLFVLANNELQMQFDLSVYTADDSPTCLARRLDRDIESRGIPKEEGLKQYKTFVEPALHRIIEPSSKYAHLVIPGAGRNFHVIDKLVGCIWRSIQHQRREAIQGTFNQGQFFDLLPSGTRILRSLAIIDFLGCVQEECGFVMPRLAQVDDRKQPGGLSLAKSVAEVRLKEKEERKVGLDHDP